MAKKGLDPMRDKLKAMSPSGHGVLEFSGDMLYEQLMQQPSLVASTLASKLRDSRNTPEAHGTCWIIIDSLLQQASSPEDEAAFDTVSNNSSAFVVCAAAHACLWWHSSSLGPRNQATNSHHLVNHCAALYSTVCSSQLPSPGWHRAC